MKLVWFSFLSGLLLVPNFCFADNKASVSSLAYIFYKNSPLPSSPDDKELAQLDSLLKKYGVKNHHQIGLLEKFYGKDKKLWALVSRDSDHDGIKDYRICDYTGKIFEGDTDIDGDGISNVEDSQPYKWNKEIIDSNANGIADHIDFRFTKDPSTAQIQENIFNRYGILLVEKSFDFSLVFLEVLEKVLQTLDLNELDTLKYIAAEKSIFLDPEPKDENPTFAMYTIQNLTLTFYEHSFSISPFEQMTLIAHEIAHPFHYQLDYKDSSHLYHLNLYPAKNFYDLLSDFGWEISSHFTKLTDDFHFIFLQYEFLDDDYKATYLGKNEEQWKIILGDFEGQSIENEQFKNWNIASEYSMVDPIEWFAEHMAAMMSAESLKSLKKICGKHSPLISDKINQLMIEKWNFAYKNSLGSKVYDFIKTSYLNPKGNFEGLVQFIIQKTQNLKEICFH